MEKIAVVGIAKAVELFYRSLVHSLADLVMENRNYLGRYLYFIVYLLDIQCVHSLPYSPSRKLVQQLLTILRLLILAFLEQTKIIRNIPPIKFSRVKPYQKTVST